MGHSASIERQLSSVEHEIKPNELRSLQKQVLLEYPFLVNIFESVLITDNRLPDCPIVFCNDLFEQMTLYPKEEIIGRNYRFLQGPDTDKKFVKQIRRAVDGGLELEVELLNYRKDGVPFYNKFLMLPIHAPNETKGEVHYFIAIQKDVTTLRQPGSNPYEWKSPEVGMWLYHSQLTAFLSPFLSHKITGKQLFTLTKQNLSFIASKSTSEERKTLLTKIVELGLNPGAGFANVEPKRTSGFIQERSKTGEIAIGGNVNTAKFRSWWRKTRRMSTTLIGHSLSNNPDEQAEGYNAVRETCSSRLITLKLFYQKDIILMQVPITITFSLLMEKLMEEFKVPLKCKYKDNDGDWVLMEDNDDVEAAMLCRTGLSLSLRIRKKFKPLSQEKQLYLKVLPVGIAVVDGEGDLIYMNPFAENLLSKKLEDYRGKNFENCFGKGLDLELREECQDIDTPDGEILTACVATEKMEYNTAILLSK